MLKGLGILASGIFVGAVGMEIIHKKYPEGLDKLHVTMNELTAKVRGAFMDGYYSAVKPGETAKAA